MRRIVVLALVAILALGVLGFAQELGTKDNPYRLILVPSTDTAVIEATGPVIAQAIYDRTGLYVEAYMTPDTTAAVAEYATAEEDVFGFLSTKCYLQAFVETLAATGEHVDFTLISVRNHYTGYWAGFYVRRDSGIDNLLDLEGKKWGYAYPGSSSGYAMPRVTLDKLGITVGNTLETGSHDATLIAVVNGDVDFGTAYFSPPNPPIYLRQMDLYWEPGMDLETGIWVDEKYVDAPWGETSGSYLEESGWYLKDLREKVYLDGSIPDIVEQVKVIGISDIIPNDGVSFVPGFPEDDKQAITQALLDYIHSLEGKLVMSQPGFYAWDDLYPATDAIYDSYRLAKGYEIPER